MPLSSEFTTRYSRLNPKQREAVDAIEGPVMVIAGPGTGKTTILTLRIANILTKTDTPPSGILAITYTDSGVKAMRTKLREVIGGRADEVRIHTFHGFAASIINEFREHFPHISKAEQISDIEAESLVREILSNATLSDLRPFGNPDMYVRPILGAISECKKEAWTPSILRDFARDEKKRIESDPDSLSTRGATKGELKADVKKKIERLGKTVLLADVYEKYENLKREKHLIDFDDLIIELLLALERDELLLRLLQEKFLYLLVDEHQDTNDSQNLLVKMIASFFESPNLFIVGDEKQAIYRFQGASVENFLRFQSVWSDMKVISLTDNYRSHQTILDAGFALIENNYSEGEHTSLRVELKAGHRDAEKLRRPIDIISAGNIAGEEAWLAQSVEKIRVTDPEASIAVIVRKNRLVERALNALESRGVQAAAERGADIFSHPAGSLFFDLVRFLADPSYVEGLARTLAAGLWHIPFGEASEIIAQLRAGKVADIEKRIPALAKLSRDFTQSGALSFIIHAADVSGFLDAIVHDPLALEVWRGITVLSEEIVRRTDTDDPLRLLKELVSYATSAESRSVKVFAGSPDAHVTVMTAHGSKGLEFDYVFMPYATEDSWITTRRGPAFILPRDASDDDAIRDTRRLFYVAMTRARKHLSISSSLEGQGGKETLPVRFIGELPEVSVAFHSIKALKDPIGVGTKEKGGATSGRDEVLADFARHAIADRGISVTALNHFLSCPARFFYKSILRLPEAPSASSEKGNAMHAALDAVWKLREKTTKTIEAQIISVVKDYFDTKSLLPTFEREALVKELVKNAPKVSVALVDHFNQPGTSMSEIWSEARLGDVRIHGRIDALVTTDSTAFIFDYKTKEAMSENQIRGLTKDSTGDYFRQLVFYKLLLKNDPRTKGKVIEPVLVFVSPDSKGRCPIVSLPITKSDEDAVLADIDALLQSVRSGDVVRSTCDDPECKECVLRKFSSNL